MGLCLPFSRYRPNDHKADVSHVTVSSNPLRAYAAVTASYWAFMLSDGALRMLVLLHFNALGFSPLQLAWLFLLYEVAGIVTNLAAGWLTAVWTDGNTLWRVGPADWSSCCANAAQPSMVYWCISRLRHGRAGCIRRGQGLG